MEEWESEDSRERCVPVVGGEEVVRELSEQEQRGASEVAHVSRGDTVVPEEVKEEHPAEHRRPIHWNYAHKQIPLNSKSRVTTPGNAVSVYTDLISLEQGEGEKPFSLEEEREGRVIDTHVKRESSRQNDDIKWSKAHGRGSLKRSPRHDFLPYSPRKKGKTAMMSTSGGTSKFTAPGPGLFKRSRGIASMSADIRRPERPWPRVELSSDDESHPRSSSSFVSIPGFEGRSAASRRDVRFRLSGEETETEEEEEGHTSATSSSSAPRLSGPPERLRTWRRRETTVEFASQVWRWVSALTRRTGGDIEIAIARFQALLAVRWQHFSRHGWRDQETVLQMALAPNLVENYGNWRGLLPLAHDLHPGTGVSYFRGQIEDVCVFARDGVAIYGKYYFVIRQLLAILDEFLHGDSSRPLQTVVDRLNAKFSRDHRTFAQEGTFHFNVA